MRGASCQHASAMGCRVRRRPNLQPIDLHRSGSGASPHNAPDTVQLLEMGSGLHLHVRGNYEALLDWRKIALIWPIFRQMQMRYLDHQGDEGKLYVCGRNVRELVHGPTDRTKSRLFCLPRLGILSRRAFASIWRLFRSGFAGFAAACTWPRPDLRAAHGTTGNGMVRPCSCPASK
jgi:hypothetical protein